MLRLIGSLTVMVLLLVGCGGGSGASAPSPPVIAAGSAPDGAVGTAYPGYTFAVASGGAAPLTWSATGALPPGLELSSAGQLTGTPVTAGTYAFTVQVAAGTPPLTGTLLVSVRIAGPAPIQITSGPPPAATVGAAYDQHLESCHAHGLLCWVYGFPLSASGGVGTVTWSWAAAPGSSLPPGLSLAGNLINGTAPVRSIGSYRVIVSATDGGTSPGTAQQQYTINILNPPPPVVEALPGPHGATLNQPYSYQFQISGLAPVSASETGALPPGLAPLTATGVLAGVPNSANLYPIAVHATDAAGQQSAQAFTIGVFPHGFSTTGAMQAPRSGHTSTRLASGEVLAAGGYSLVAGEAVGVITSELFDPTTGRFAATGALQVARAGHTATLLCDLATPPCENPKVLIVGGGILASTDTAELYDPTAGTSTVTVGSLATARGNHTATRLLSGKVLIAGGTSDGVSTLASAELFDPATGTFSATAAPMARARVGHTATLLPDGRVLIAGGVGAEVLDSAELYDPAARTFSAVRSRMTVARTWHTATLLPGGKVLIAGGGATASNGDPLATAAELYDPAAVAPAASFTATGALVTPRSSHTAALLPSGQVLIVGGVYSLGSGQALQHAELYDPVSGLFTSTGGMHAEHGVVTLTVFGSGGQVLAVGGADSNATAEVYQ